MSADDGFLSRWARRKAQARSGSAVPEEVPAVAPVPAPAPAPVIAAPAPVVAAPGSESAPAAEAPPPLTMADVEQLTRESDFSAFARRNVDPQVRNAAMKKLFHSDPHFNAMDGLDIYIDDYNKADPLPKAMLRQMVQARFLGLLDDEVEDQDKPRPDVATAEPPAADTPPPDEDADLQLQPHDAAGRAGAEPGAGGGRTDG